MSDRAQPSAGDRAAGFERLLALLGPDPAERATRFEALRGRLNRFFLWRGVSDPDSLTDETLDRAAGKLAAGLVIEADDPFRYLAGIARLVALESHQRERRTRDALESARHEPAPAPETSEEDTRHGCLERCLARLDAATRRQILDVYRGEKGGRIARRKAMASALGITVNALRIRAHRVRAKLEACVRACMADASGGEMLPTHAPPGVDRHGNGE